MFNRRYALLGWAVWKVGKIAAKRRARSMVPSISADRRPPAPGRALIVPAVAVAGGAVAVWFLFFRRAGAEQELEAERELAG